jgi:hypothetical protein
MLTGVIGLAISALSFVYAILRAVSKNSTGYMKREMNKFYLGTEE